MKSTSLTKAKSIFPILGCIFVSWICIYMIKESLSVLYPASPTQPTSISQESQQWINEYTKSVSDKNPNHEAKGQIGAIFFLVLCGFTLLLVGGGGLLITYQTWIKPDSPKQH